MNIKSICKWYYQTSAIVGIPLLFLLLLWGTQKFVFTLTCSTSGYQCEHAIGATDVMAGYMSEMLDSNPNMDLVAKPKRK